MVFSFLITEFRITEALSNVHFVGKYQDEAQIGVKTNTELSTCIINKDGKENYNSDTNLNTQLNVTENKLQCVLTIKPFSKTGKT